MRISLCIYAKPPRGIMREREAGSPRPLCRLVPGAIYRVRVFIALRLTLPGKVIHRFAVVTDVAVIDEVNVRAAHVALYVEVTLGVVLNLSHW